MLQHLLHHNLNQIFYRHHRRRQTKKNNSNQQQQQLTTTNNNNNFKVIPSLRLKTNELFFRYLSDKERQAQIKEIIAYIKLNNSIPKINELASFINTKVIIFLINFI